jgi:hypothetical protein
MSDVSVGVRVRAGAQFLSVSVLAAAGRYAGTATLGASRKFGFRMQLSRTGGLALLVGPLFFVVVREGAAAPRLVS